MPTTAESKHNKKRHNYVVMPEAEATLRIQANTILLFNFQRHVHPCTCIYNCGYICICIRACRSQFQPWCRSMTQGPHCLRETDMRQCVRQAFPASRRRCDAPDTAKRLALFERLRIWRGWRGDQPARKGNGNHDAAGAVDKTGAGHTAMRPHAAGRGTKSPHTILWRALRTARR